MSAAGHTWEEFLALDEHDTRELIDGELLELEMPTPSHERIVTLLCYFLEAWARSSGGGTTFPSGLKVRVSDRRGVMPDVQFYRAGNRPWGANAVESGRPDLAIEIISPRNVRYDRVVKLSYYAALGVPEYWLIDREGGVLERLVLERERYVIAEALSGDDVFAPASFPGLRIALRELWEAASDPTPQA